MDHELIGSFSTNLNELLSGKRDYELKHPHKVAKNKKYTNSGTIHIDSIELIKQHSFLEFIAGGCEISLIVAIDFTASNGNPMHSTSLHYNNPYQPNEYVSAIKAVGDILSAYDSDRLFPAFGFGAKLPPTMEVSHCFALNGNPSNVRPAPLLCFFLLDQFLISPPVFCSRRWRRFKESCRPTHRPSTRSLCTALLSLAKSSAWRISTPHLTRRKRIKSISSCSSSQTVSSTICRRPLIGSFSCATCPSQSLLSALVVLISRIWRFWTLMITRSAPRVVFKPQEISCNSCPSESSRTTPYAWLRRLWLKSLPN